MRFLWPKDSSIKVKVCTTIIFLLFFCFSWGITSNFEPSSIFFTIALFAVLPIAILFSLPSQSLIVNMDKFNPEKQNLIKIILFLMIYVLIFITVTYGVPSIYVENYGRDFSYTGIIIKKEVESSRGDREYILTTRELDDYSAKHLDTKVTREVYDSVQKTQLVTITGKEIVIGKMVLEIW